MSLTFLIPVASQHNCNKSSALLHQNQYHSKLHTPPEKCGASVKCKPPPGNQQAPQVSQYKKNSKNTPLSNSSNLSITAAILWPLLIKTPVFFLAKKIATLTGNIWEYLQCVRWHQHNPECDSYPLKVLALVCTKMINIIPL